jgi:hypothetical protein
MSTQGNAGERESAENFYNNFDKELDETICKIEKHVLNERPDKAFEVMSEFICLSNFYSQFCNKIPQKLSSTISKWKDILEKIAKLFKATSFSITVSAPIGISLGLTWGP